MPSRGISRKYTLDPEGQVRAGGPQGPHDGPRRHSGNASAPRPPTSSCRFDPGKDFEVLTTLRALVKNQPVDAASASRRPALTRRAAQDLADRMKRAKFGVIFFGMGLSMTRGKHMNSAGILMLAAEMNAFTKFVCMPMRGHGNVTGSDMVLRWTTGLSVRHQSEPRAIRASIPESSRRSI